MLIQYYLYEVNMEKDLYTGLLGIMKAFFLLRKKYMDKNKGKKLKVAVLMNILLNSIR